MNQLSQTGHREAERWSVSVNVVDCGMVHYKEQPWKARRGVMVSEASFATVLPH